MNEERQRGQSVVLVALVFLGLLVFAAIAVDMSSAYFHRRKAQNAADAAALAGAQDLGRQRNLYGDKIDVKGDAWEIKRLMNDLAERNGIEDTDPSDPLINDNVQAYYLDWHGELLSTTPFPTKHNEKPPEDAFGIEAVTYMTAPTFFGGAVGYDGYPLDAEAAVSINAAVCDVSCVVPIATYWCEPDSDSCEPAVVFEPSDDPIWYPFFDDPDPFWCYNIWNGDGPGNFGWLNWSIQVADGIQDPEVICDQDQCSAQCLSHNLLPEHCGNLSVGDPVAGATGVKTAEHIRDALGYYVGDPLDESKPPKPFVVPVWNQNNGEQGCGDADSGLHYIVAGFAEMQLIGYKLPQGEGVVEHDPWIDPSACQDIYPPGNDPNAGNRLTAYFKGLVTSVPSGTCDPSGTITTIRLTK